MTALLTLGPLAVGLTIAVPVHACPLYATDYRSEAALVERTADQLADALISKEATSVELTKLYLDRIRTLDPLLHSVIAITPDALEQARASDARRKAGEALGRLDGIPVMLKDNIETKELPTTAGSLALRDNRTFRDAPLVSRLRKLGLVILGKTNLSEWSNFRSTGSMSGWSAMGGLVRNPYALDRTACGSSSGSAVAVSASLTTLAVGTDTIGSLPCPAAMSGIAALRPTLGKISRTHIIPVSSRQDTAGPMARSVKDLALLLDAMSEYDPDDPVTRFQISQESNLAATLTIDGLRNRRIGYWKPQMSEALNAAFAKALDQLRSAGAQLVEVERPQLEVLPQIIENVLNSEFKTSLNNYLVTASPSVKTRTLHDLIAFNEANRATEMAFFGQEVFLNAERTQGTDDPEYRRALAKAIELAGRRGIDAMLHAGKAEILVTPTIGLPWLSDPLRGDQAEGFSALDLPAIAGYPHLTVPMGQVSGLPVGLSFIGPAGSDGLLLRAGYAFEQRSHARVAPCYFRTVPVDLGPRVQMK